MASLRVPLTSTTSSGGGGGAHPIGGAPPTYETFSSTYTSTTRAKALAAAATTEAITGEAEQENIERGITYARRPFSSPDENGLPLPPPDLKRLQRIIWRRRIFSFFPPMSQKFAERLRLAAPHVLLFIATMVYGIVGAVIIYRIEKPHEQSHIFSHSKAIIDAQNELFHVQVDHASPNSTNQTIEEAIDKLISVSFDAFAEGVKSNDLQLLRTNNTRISRWSFHSALFFTATVLTSIGFGDLVPEDEPHYFGWILFMFAGLILTTLTVDMCGSAGIDSLHMFGRVDPRKLLNGIFHKSHDKSAFEPHDIRIIPYIDEIIKNYENSVAKMSI
uniref:Potassium channel domain-containing protein n=1 Tax=Panagrolaimus sp. ES5 TaxID=591445 RepID=A0AC34FRI6_9BILA